MTRCKVGDLAIITWSVCGNEGKLVRCLENMGVYTHVAPDGTERDSVEWRIDRLIPNWAGVMEDRIADDQLRPIRPPAQEDETETVKEMESV